jgi:peptide chain release factor subunit 1
MDDVNKLKLKRIIEELKKIHGRHTELVTVYVPAGYDINLVTNQISQEQGTASNIKSKSTRKNVTAALDKIIQELKLYKKTPDNGMAIFSGNASEREGVQDVQIWIIEPPEPLGVRMYRCDQDFVIGPLEEMMDSKYSYGLIVIDNKNATIGVLKGKRTQVLREFKSIVPGKYRAGGQSAARFARAREGLQKDWYKKVADQANVIFSEIDNLSGVLIGGPGPTKEIFIEAGGLRQEYKKKIIAIQDIGYSSSFGLQELVDKSLDVLEKEGFADEKILVQEFLKGLKNGSNLIEYGEEVVMKAIQQGAAEKVLISESISNDKIDEFQELCKEFGTEVVLVSEDTREGQQLEQIGGFGAFLRFNV